MVLTTQYDSFYNWVI